MKIALKAAAVLAFASLFGCAIYSQAISSTSNAPQAPRITVLNGVTSITDRPFSADLETEQTQTLVDGSHIRTVQHSKYYRDGIGRMRQETYIRRGQGPEELSSVQIVDPAANLRYNLQPGSHIARSSTVFAPHSPTPAPQRVTPFPNPQQASLAPKTVAESLGTQTMEGISVEGRRMTTTFPVNSQGNDAPLVYTNETWQSTELGISVLTKNISLRSGEHISRFTNIIQGEQDPSLFQVPADYTVKEF